MDQETDEPEYVSGLLPKQELFCQEYIKDFHGQNAAVRAGYEAKNARIIASRMINNDQCRKYIKHLLDDIDLGEGAVKKLITDIAKSSLNDYFTIRKVEHRPMVEKSLKMLIDEAQAEIEFEEEFANAAGLSDEQYEDHMAMQNSRRLKKLRFELELKRNPNATRIVVGDPVLIEVPELDMAKVVADKEKGKIKSITPGQFGTKVELYSADAALTNLAKIHGLFEKDNAHKHEHTGKDGAPLKAPVTFISADALTPEQIEKYLNGDRTDNEGF